MRNKTIAILGGLALLLGSVNFATACERCGCQKGHAYQKVSVFQKGSVVQKGGACQKGCGCRKDCGNAWAGYCSKGCGIGKGSCLHRSKGTSCGCDKGGKCSSGRDSCGDSCGCGGKKKGCGLFSHSRFLGGGKTFGSKCGPMPQTCYNPRFGCYSGNNRHMQRYPAFHGHYYRRPYNYRNLADYPWHAELHEPTSHFSYNVPPEEAATDERPGFDSPNVSTPDEPAELEDIAPPLPEEARRPQPIEPRQASSRRSSVHMTNFRR